MKSNLARLEGKSDCDGLGSWLGEASLQTAHEPFEDSNSVVDVVEIRESGPKD
jgi:hypothetical protein